MKHQFRKYISGLLLMVFITLTSSCALIISEARQPRHPRHRNRIVWVSGIQYRQVYYVENNNIVIVSQVEHQQKPRKAKHNNGNNGNNGHHGH